MKKPVKKRSYAILTSDSKAIHVKARNIDEAYRKAKKEHQSLKKSYAKNPKLKEIFEKDSKVTSAYMTFGRDGINTAGWISTGSSLKASKRKLRK